MSEPRVEIRCGDCREIMAGMEPESVDAIVTDPPYGEGAARWDRTSTDWHEAWLREAMRVLRPDAPMLIFQSRRLGYELDLALVRLGVPIRGQLIWWHGQGFAPRPDQPRIAHEPIRWAGGGSLRAGSDEVRQGQEYVTPHPVVRRKSRCYGFGEWTYKPHPAGPMASTVFRGARNKHSEVSGHPTQKPVDLMEWLVCLACPPDGTVLDCFAGSGTTLVAALGSGRNAVGIEMDAGYCDLIRKRLDGVQVSLPMEGTG